MAVEDVRSVVVVRAVIDATAIPVNRGGVGRYLDFLIPALLGLDTLELTVVAQQRDAGQFRDLGATVLEAPAAIRRRAVRLAWEQTGLPALVRGKGDVLHCPHYTLPVLSPLPTVVTLHDATFFSDPQWHTPAKQRLFTRATRLAVRRADQLVVPSAATRDELVRHVSAAARRAVVAPLGVDAHTFRPPTDAEIGALREHLGLGAAPFIAFLGTIEPRKNVPNLIRAWVKAAAGLDEPPVLVLAGAPGWDDAVAAAVQAVPPHLRLIRAGYLPLPLLPALLGGATVVAYPSLGEGFGLPVLEAMACGAAVLTTRRLSLPEVGGSAVRYCDVDDGSIADALVALLADPAQRAELAGRARDRAAHFTWAESARIHAQAYAAAIGSRGGHP